MFWKLTMTAFMMTLVAPLTACGGARAEVELPPLHGRNFAYQGHKQGDGAKTLSIALIRPKFSASYAAKFNSRDDGGQAYLAALDRALLNYFTVNGFTVSGPFESLDAMTFPEKKQVDLVLLPEADYDWQLPTTRAFSMREGFPREDRPYMHAHGLLRMTGALHFTLWEPLSGQRMWTKDVQAADQSVNVQLEAAPLELYQRVMDNAVAKCQEASFKQAVAQMERYFHPDEVRLVKEQAVELRAKKVY